MKDNKKCKRKLSFILATLAALLGILILGFFIYANQYYRTDSEARAAVTQNAQVTLNYEKDYLVLSPNENDLKEGIIFYPGGKVEYDAYARMLSTLTESGYTCIIPKMPFNLAVFNQDAATSIIADFPEMKDWYVGGHSLGGAMAAVYASEHSDSLKGLILLGSYSTKDLSTLPLKVLSIYGSEDQVLNKENYQNNKIYLPEDTTELCIEGGNHAFYADYGMQKGDGHATITPEKQQELTANAILEFLNDSN